MAFKVALIACDKSGFPEWVPGKLAESGIDFKAKLCRDEADFIEFAGDADVIWTLRLNRVITPESLPKLKKCKAIMRSGSGVEGLPVEEATRLGIWIANTPEAIAETVADHAIALLFAVVRQIPFYERAVRRGVWNALGPSRIRWHISGQTLGLVGFGQIARHVAAKMSGFKMRLLCYDPFVQPEVMARHQVQAASLDDLLVNADFISVHCPLNNKTRHLIGLPEFARMKKTALLINTSRGPVLDEDALLQALQTGQIAGAGLDVLTEEPPPANHPLLSLENVVFSPHIAAFSDEFDQKFWECSVAAIKDFKRGHWQEHSVNRVE